MKRAANEDKAAENLGPMPLHVCVLRLRNLCKEMVARLTEPQPPGRFPDIRDLAEAAGALATAASFAMPIEYVVPSIPKEFAAGLPVQQRTVERHMLAVALSSAKGFFCLTDPITSEQQHFPVFLAPGDFFSGGECFAAPRSQVKARRDSAVGLRRWVRFLNQLMEEGSRWHEAANSTVRASKTRSSRSKWRDPQHKARLENQIREYLKLRATATIREIGGTVEASIGWIAKSEAWRELGRHKSAQAMALGKQEASLTKHGITVRGKVRAHQAEEDEVDNKIDAQDKKFTKQILAYLRKTPNAGDQEIAERCTIPPSDVTRIRKEMDARMKRSQAPQQT